MGFHQISRTYKPPPGSSDAPATLRITYHAEPGILPFHNAAERVGHTGTPTEVTFHAAEVEVGVGEYIPAPPGLAAWAERHVDQHADALAAVEPPRHAWADPAAHAPPSVAAPGGTLDG